MNESNVCPSCGNTMNEGEETCLACGFSYSTVLKCPYKKEDNTCERTELTCHIHDMGWEVCDKLREGNF